LSPLSHKEGYLLTSTLLLGLRRSRQIKERYATSRLSPLNRGESNVTNGDIDAPLLMALLLCDLSTVSSRHCRHAHPMQRHR
jgi:hypothetical protein